MKPQTLGKLQRHILLSIILFLALFGVSLADTNVSGNITSDTTWTQANSPYIVTGGMQVFPEVALTIEPGVTVKFSKDTFLRIGGELIAKGAATQMITFTSNETTPDAGDWGRIAFVGGSVGSILDEDGEYVSGSIIEYCKIEYGEGMFTEYIDLYIAHNIINNNASSAITVNDPYGFSPSSSNNAIITGNTITENSGSGISVCCSNNAIITGNTITDNSDRGIHVESSDNAIITGNTIIDNSGSGISLIEGISVRGSNNAIITGNGAIFG